MTIVIYTTVILYSEINVFIFILHLSLPSLVKIGSGFSQNLSIFYQNLIMHSVSSGKQRQRGSQKSEKQREIHNCSIFMLEVPTHSFILNNKISHKAAFKCTL